MIAAIVAAAGVGERMGHKVPKPYLLLGGKPILAHTLGVFEQIREIREVTLVVHPDELDYCQERVISPYGFKKVLRLVPGGKERQDSVYNALKALQNEDDLEIVLVHDGVRPFVTPDQVQKVIQAARSHGGAVLGLPAHDTLKTVNAAGDIHHTLERKDIWQIQTPQAFQAALLWRAFTEAYSRNFYGTDESSLVEQLLQQVVVVVAGSPLNLKITTPEDLAMAEAILHLMRKGRRRRESRSGL
jgi:2-C-methyl-D-erythritol 4-phosphate cytidylyltransferase